MEVSTNNPTLNHALIGPINFFSTNLFKEVIKNSRYIKKSVKEQILNEQKYCCANKSGNLPGLERYHCQLWSIDGPDKGKFRESGHDIDHIVEFSVSGNNDISNLQALCVDCHRVKTKRFMENKHKTNIVMIDPDKATKVSSIVIAPIDNLLKLRMKIDGVEPINHNVTQPKFPNVPSNGYNLVAFTDETIILTDTMKYRIMNDLKPMNAIITEINFNPQMKNHHNFYYADTKCSKCLVFNGTKWVEENVRAVIQTLCEVRLKNLQEIFDSVELKLDPNVRNRMKTYLYNMGVFLSSDPNYLANYKSPYYSDLKLFLSGNHGYGKKSWNSTRNYYEIMATKEKTFNERDYLSLTYGNLREIVTDMISECGEKINGDITNLIDNANGISEMNVIINYLMMIMSTGENANVDVLTKKIQNQIEMDEFANKLLEPPKNENLIPCMKESINILTKEDKIEILKGSNPMTGLMKTLNFNPNYSNNHNIKLDAQIANCRYYNGCTWVNATTDIFLKMYYNAKFMDLVNIFKSVANDLDNDTQLRVRGYILNLRDKLA